MEASPTQAELFINPSFKPETYHLNYLTIPILLQYNVVKSFLIQAGPQYGILLDQSKDGVENARVAFSSGEFFNRISDQMSLIQTPEEFFHAIC